MALKDTAKYPKKQARLIQRRFILLFVGVSCLLLLLSARIAWLQVINPTRLINEGDMRTLRSQKIPVTRGIIADRNGRPLAVSVPSYSICAQPKQIDFNQIAPNDERWAALASALSMSHDQFMEKITNPDANFFYLSRQVTPEIAEYVRELKISGICLEQSSRRFYPAGPTTAHIIGFTDIDSKGIEGIEKSFDQWLTGEAGTRVVRKDRSGRVIEHVYSIDSKTSHDLTLSIDEQLQSIVYLALNHGVELNKAESGSAVLIDIQTGEILAMVNSPSYNPNNRAGVSADIMRNRSLVDMFEPGSTVKPIVIMTALDEGVINERTVMNTRGPFVVNGKEIKDVAPRSSLDIAGVIRKSSNIGVAKIALQMKSEVLVKSYMKFGFGRSNNLGLIGETSGIFPSNKKYWADIERATFAYGYGLMTTPLQLASAYATIGSGGIHRPVSITKVDPPIIGERIMPEKTVRTVVRMMESVTLPGESGSRAAVEGYRVAVKTGTAKKVGSKGQYIEEYIAYTAGIAPVSNPRFALVVMIDNPKAGRIYGGAVSAPVFSNVMNGVLRMMNIKPDALPPNKDMIVIDKN